MRPPGRPRLARDGLHPLPRAPFLASALALVAIVLATRVPFASQYLFNWDAGNFALALSYYNVAWHQPHPPGYPVYVATAWLVRLVTGDANAALVALSVGGSAVAAVATFGCAWRLAGRSAAVLAAVFFVTSANVWGHGLIASPRILLALVASVLAWVTVETRWGRRDFSRFGAVVLGLGAGLRPDVLPFLGGLWLFGAAARGRRAVLTGAALGTGVVLSWLVPMIASIGWPAFRESLTESARYWAPPAADGVAYLWTVWDNTAKVVRFSALALGPVGTVALVAGLTLAAAVPRLSATRWRRLAPLLAVWLAPASTFFMLAHVNEPGHVLLLFPALAIVAGSGAATLGSGLARAARQHPGRRLATAGPVLAVLSGLAIASNTLTFWTASDPDTVSRAYVRMVDQDTAAELELVRSLPLESTVVVSLSRFRQHYYYLPEHYWRGRLISVLGVLGRLEDVPPATVRPPGDARTVVIFDLGADATDPTVRLDAVAMPFGVPATVAHIQDGDVLRLTHKRVTIVRKPASP